MTTYKSSKAEPAAAVKLHLPGTPYHNKRVSIVHVSSRTASVTVCFLEDASDCYKKGEKMVVAQYELRTLDGMPIRGRAA